MRKKKLLSLQGPSVYLAKVQRPRGSDPKISPGMRLYADPEGHIVARKRAPKGGGHVIGIVITEGNSGCETLLRNLPAQ
jgi:hypothetical protein